MDDRQRQIREGAGLAESRLNEEFIEFLQKWSMPLLVVIAALAVGYTVFGKVQKARNEKVDLAFQELDAAASTANPNPESLQRIAEEYSGVRAVPIQARLAAADALLKTVRSGIKPGAQLNRDATLASPDDALTEKDRDSALSRARDLYQQVYDESATNQAQRPFTISALYGLASVAECRKELDGARAHYEKIISLCDKTAFALHAAIARERTESLEKLRTDVKLYSMKDIVPIPQPAGASAPAPSPTPAPTPAPAPAPAPAPGAAAGSEPAPGAPGIAPAQTPGPETKPVETKPVEPKPAEPKPAETKPAEPKPAEPKPVEPAPAEPKPGAPK